MTRIWHKTLQLVIGFPQPWEDHVDNIATSFYVRGLAQNISMLGFLGQLSSSLESWPKADPYRLVNDIALWTELSYGVFLGLSFTS
jgi:hypothetical protein